MYSTMVDIYGRIQPVDVVASAQKVFRSSVFPNRLEHKVELNSTLAKKFEVCIIALVDVAALIAKTVKVLALWFKYHRCHGRAKSLNGFLLSSCGTRPKFACLKMGLRALANADRLEGCLDRPNGVVSSSLEKCYWWERV